MSSILNLALSVSQIVRHLLHHSPQLLHILFYQVSDYRPRVRKRKIGDRVLLHQPRHWSIPVGLVMCHVSVICWPLKPKQASSTGTGKEWFLMSNVSCCFQKKNKWIWDKQKPSIYTVSSSLPHCFILPILFCQSFLLKLIYSLFNP